MGRDAKRAKQARRDKRRREADGRGAGVPPFPEAEIERIWHAWSRAIDSGLMEDGAERKYHFTPDGRVLSVAVGRSGQVLANGERLTPSVAERLRREMPFLAPTVTFYENNQAAGCGLEGAPGDGVIPLPGYVPGPGPAPSLDTDALEEGGEARQATGALVRAGKVAEGVGAIVIPSQRGVLVAEGVFVAHSNE
ncbi:hypothetical protein [Streptomyces syringium]|uniref:hypothetical protein n=1 Tax=Streptomyces syringium TaxID=76729 RepID=UPI0033F0BB17